MKTLLFLTFITLYFSHACANYSQAWSSVLDFANTTGTIYAVAYTRVGIAIGGDFTFSTPSGPARHFVFVHNNGTVRTFDMNAPVYALQIDFPCVDLERQLLVGGSFTKWGSEDVRGFAVLDLQSFQLAELSNLPYIIGTVKAIGFNGKWNMDLWIGGLFWLKYPNGTAANCTLATFSFSDSKWFCKADTSKFSSVNAVVVTAAYPASVIAVGTPAYVMLLYRDGVFTYINQTGVSGSSYSIGYNKFEESGHVFIGGDSFINQFDDINLGGQTAIIQTAFSGSVNRLVVTSSPTDYKEETLWFAGSFPGMPNGDSTVIVPIYSNGFQAYNIRTGVVTTNQVSPSWFGNGTIIRDFDFDSYSNPSNLYVGGNFARVGMIDKTRNIAALSLAPMTKSSTTVCIISSSAGQYLVADVQAALSLAFNTVLLKNMTSSSVASDFSDCSAAIAISDIVAYLGYTSFGNAMLTRVKQGMTLVLTQAAMNSDVAMFGTSTFVSEAMCSGQSSSFGLKSNLNDRVPSPLMTGIEFFWNFFYADVSMNSNTNNTLYATQSTATYPNIAVGVCSRKVANNAGGSTSVVQLNIVPQTGWVNGDFGQLMIQALKL